MSGARRILFAPLLAAAILAAAAPSRAASDIAVIPGVGPQLAASAAPAEAEPRARDLGGGFIEFVLTGRTDGARRQGASLAAAPRAEPIARQPAIDPVMAALAPPEAAPAELQGEPDPQFARQEVDYSGREKPGTIIIDTPSKFLFLVEPNGRALRYGIGVGRPGFEWAGVKRVSRKAEWPGWTPPSQMLLRRPDLPSHMPGGLGNPLGARALYLGSSLYRIHGTNEPWTIGKNVSSGCIRMMNPDVIDLYNRTPVGAKVIVL